MIEARNHHFLVPSKSDDAEIISGMVKHTNDIPRLK